MGVLTTIVVAGFLLFNRSGGAANTDADFLFLDEISRSPLSRFLHLSLRSTEVLFLNMIGHFRIIFAHFPVPNSLTPILKWVSSHAVQNIRFRLCFLLGFCCCCCCGCCCFSRVLAIAVVVVVVVVVGNADRGNPEGFTV